MLVIPEQQASGVQLLETASACVPIVASDIAAHRKAAAQVDGAGVTFVAAAAPARNRTSIARRVRIALAAGSYTRHPDGLERHISAVAAEPARRGARFEVLTQDHVRGLPRGSELGGRPPATRHVVKGTRWFRSPAGVPEE